MLGAQTLSPCCLPLTASQPQPLTLSSPRSSHSHPRCHALTAGPLFWQLQGEPLHLDYAWATQGWLGSSATRTQTFPHPVCLPKGVAFVFMAQNGSLSSSHHISVLVNRMEDGTKES